MTKMKLCSFADSHQLADLFSYFAPKIAFRDLIAAKWLHIHKSWKSKETLKGMHILNLLLKNTQEKKPTKREKSTSASHEKKCRSQNVLKNYKNEKKKRCIERAPLNEHWKNAGTLCDVDIIAKRPQTNTLTAFCLVRVRSIRCKMQFKNCNYLRLSDGQRGSWCQVVLFFCSCFVQMNRMFRHWTLDFFRKSCFCQVDSHLFGVAEAVKMPFSSW